MDKSACGVARRVFPTTRRTVGSLVDGAHKPWQPDSRRLDRHSFKPGDRVELVFNPLRDGKHGGAFDKATFLDTGQVISSDLRAAEKPGLQ